MQIPLVTNFSRGILSPKFYGRVETEIYAAGAAEIENFIVNNQGSVERRPGTYRIWNTNWTHPVDGDEDKFAVEFIPEQRYSLSVVDDGGRKAQIILSTQGEHRFFELERGEYMQNNDIDLFVLTEVEEGGNRFQEAHAFSLDESNAGSILDDAFLVTLEDITFMRLRSAIGYTALQTKIWHKILSRRMARSPGTTPPFVTATPKEPPEYDRDISVLSHSVGAYITDKASGEAEVDFGVRHVPQVVGAKCYGQYKDFPERSKMFGTSGERNSTEVIPPDHEWVTVTIPNAFPEDERFTFYEFYPGHADIEIDGVPVDSYYISNPLRLDQTVKIRLQVFHNHGNVITVKYAREKKKKTNPLPWHTKIRTVHTYRYHNIDVTELVNAKRAFYLNRNYTLETPVTWNTEDFTYELRLHSGAGAVLRDGISMIGKYTPLPGGGAPEVTHITIHDEFNLHPEGGRLRAGDYFVFERHQVDMEQEVVARRVKPWVRTESPTDFSLEIVTDIEAWKEHSSEAIRNSKSVAMGQNRLMLLKDETRLEFQISSLRDYINFSEGDSDLDAYTFTIESDKREQVQWMVSMREGIVLGTEKNEYVVVNSVSPSTIASRRYTGFGSSRPYALRFGDKILFVSRDAKRIFAYMYSDELSAWHSQDITSVAQHLFEGGIQSIHYQQDPITIIWVVPEGNDGIYALTWEDSTGVMAWTHHFAGVNVLAAAPVTIHNKTILLLAVERNGYVVIEGLDLMRSTEDGLFYIDSAEYLIFETNPGDSETVYGPDGTAMTENYEVSFGHSRWARFQQHDIAVMVDGQTQKVMDGDGQPHVNSTLSIGPFPGADIPIEIEDENTMVTVGIGYLYTSKLQTLPILVQSPSGAGIFKDTQVQKVRVRVHNSGAFKAGNDEDDLTRVELADDEHMQELESGYYSGDVKINVQSRWMRRPQIVIESYYSDPLTVLALMADAQVYE